MEQSQSLNTERMYICYKKKNKYNTNTLQSTIHDTHAYDLQTIRLANIHLVNKVPRQKLFYETEVNRWQTLGKIRINQKLCKNTRKQAYKHFLQLNKYPLVLKINCNISTKYINKYMLMAFKFSLLYNTSEKSRIETSLFIDLKSY